MPQTFTWTPDYTSQGSHAPRVFATAFGDGYMQRAGNGINTDLASWDLTFTLSTSDATNLLTFLKAMAGTQAFYWNSPEDNLNPLWICRKWKCIPANFNRWNVTATLEQVMG